MTELRKCPFCGGEAEVWISNVTDTTVIYCKVCDAQIMRPNEQEAIEAWNERIGEVNKNDRGSRMKCPICGGTGDTKNIIPPNNEQWFCSLSTEEKAEFICNLMKGDDLYLGVMSARDMIKDELNHGKDGSFVVYEWLKEIHDEM